MIRARPGSSAGNGDAAGPQVQPPAAAWPATAEAEQGAPGVPAACQPQQAKGQPDGGFAGSRSSSTSSCGSSLTASDAAALESAAAAATQQAASKKRESHKGRRVLDDSFMMYAYKVKLCTRASSHNQKLCPWAHPGETQALRRPPSCHQPDLCPAVRMNKECPHGDTCQWARNTFESWLHPERYRTTLCSNGETCKRNICFFAHTEAELRSPTPCMPMLGVPAGAATAAAQMPQPPVQPQPLVQQPQLQQQLGPLGALPASPPPGRHSGPAAACSSSSSSRMLPVGSSPLAVALAAPAAVARAPAHSDPGSSIAVLELQPDGNTLPVASPRVSDGLLVLSQPGQQQQQQPVLQAPGVLTQLALLQEKHRQQVQQQAEEHEGQLQLLQAKCKQQQGALLQAQVQETAVLLQQLHLDADDALWRVDAASELEQAQQQQVMHQQPQGMHQLVLQQMQQVQQQMQQLQVRTDQFQQLQAHQQPVVMQLQGSACGQLSSSLMVPAGAALQQMSSRPLLQLQQQPGMHVPLQVYSQQPQGLQLSMQQQAPVAQRSPAAGAGCVQLQGPGHAAASQQLAGSMQWLPSGQLVCVSGPLGEPSPAAQQLPCTATVATSQPSATLAAWWPNM